MLNKELCDVSICILAIIFLQLYIDNKNLLKAAANSQVRIQASVGVKGFPVSDFAPVGLLSKYLHTYNSTRSIPSVEVKLHGIVLSKSSNEILVFYSRAMPSCFHTL